MEPVLTHFTGNSDNTYVGTTLAKRLKVDLSAHTQRLRGQQKAADTSSRWLVGRPNPSGGRPTAGDRLLRKERECLFPHPVLHSRSRNAPKNTTACVRTMVAPLGMSIA